MKGAASRRRAQRAGSQQASKRRAEAMRCPKCSRKSALVRIRDAAGFIVVAVCRWSDCRHEIPRDPYAPAATDEAARGAREETKR